MKTLTKQSLAELLEQRVERDKLPFICNSYKKMTLALINIVSNAICDLKVVIIPHNGRLYARKKNARIGANLGTSHPKGGLIPECFYVRITTSRVKGGMDEAERYLASTFVHDVHRLGTDEKTARAIVDTWFEFITSVIDTGDRIELRGFGTITRTIKKPVG